MEMGVFLGWRKGFETFERTERWWFHNIVNTGNATVLYTLK